MLSATNQPDFFQASQNGRKAMFSRASEPFVPTPPTNKLWRVMNFEKLDTMAQGGLWLARLDQFKDPREGRLPALNSLGLMGKLCVKDAEWIEGEYKRGVLRSYAICWHINENDPSDHVWRTFGNPKNGVAVCTTADRLRQALRSITGLDGPTYFGIVRYIDHSAQAIKDGNVIEAAFVVRREFEAEQEARVLIHTHGTAAYENLFNKRGKYGKLVASVVGTSSPSGMHELTGGHCEGKAIVLNIEPLQLITEIVPDPRLSLKSYFALLQMIHPFGLIHLVRATGIIQYLLKFLARLSLLRGK